MADHCSHYPNRRSQGVGIRGSLMFLLLGLLSLPLLDLQVYSVDPWHELEQMGWAMLSPAWQNWRQLVEAVSITIAFALCAVALSVAVGFVLSLWYGNALVRLLCASTRSVHEIFWGLIFMQVYGLSSTTGLLAIAVPYSGIFARVFADIWSEQSPLPRLVLAPQQSRLSLWLYVKVPQAWTQISTYVRYRFECALRSSVILGFIGLPTLGFYFESAFKEGHYAEAAGLLWLFFALIISLRWWLLRPLLPIYLVAALWILPDSPPLASGYLWQFLSRDIWPSSLLSGDFTGALNWYLTLLQSVVLPASLYTLALSLSALAATGLLTLICYPLASRLCAGWGAVAGHGLLVFLRSTPELVLAFVFLLLFGPSALPAIIALALHNGGLIAYLAARECDHLSLRADHPRGINLWLYELTPRLYPRIGALLLYRWEVIIRESAILGILGVTTLGFYVDSAFAEIRFDKALVLVVATALLNIAVDSISQRCNAGRRSARQQLQPVTE